MQPLKVVPMKTATKKKPKKAERRISGRKSVGGVNVSHVMATTGGFSTIARSGTIIDVSSSGILMHITREDFLPKSLRTTLSIDSLMGENLLMRISQMDLEIDGTVSRTKHLGKGLFELAVTFSDSAPKYWRECLVDLLPSPGELD
jgi:hypothetical protein